MSFSKKIKLNHSNRPMSFFNSIAGAFKPIVKNKFKNNTNSSDNTDSATSNKTQKVTTKR